MPRTRVLISIVFLIAAQAFAQNQPATNPSNVTGRWFSTTERLGAPIYSRINLTQQGDKLSGDFDGDKLQGTITGNSIQFHAVDERGGWEDAKATLSNGTMSGTLVIVFSDSKEPAETLTFTARMVVEHKANAAPKKHEFTPTTFYRRFSQETKPVLTIASGDTIHTTTVDAGGSDEKGVRRVLGGNPETGPFYIDGAYPGDTLVVHINKLTLNRDYAISDDGIVPRGLTDGLAIKTKDNNNDARWHLDLQRGIATMAKPGPHTASYEVPVKPMLGCVATAVPAAAAPPPTGDSGRFGGNMDFTKWWKATPSIFPSVCQARFFISATATLCKVTVRSTATPLKLQWTLTLPWM